MEDEVFTEEERQRVRELVKEQLRRQSREIRSEVYP